jgi:hypothetical protein
MEGLHVVETSSSLGEKGRDCVRQSRGSKTESVGSTRTRGTRGRENERKSHDDGDTGRRREQSEDGRRELKRKGGDRSNGKRVSIIRCRVLSDSAVFYTMRILVNPPIKIVPRHTIYRRRNGTGY